MSFGIIIVHRYCHCSYVRCVRWRRSRRQISRKPLEKRKILNAKITLVSVRGPEAGVVHCSLVTPPRVKTTLRGRDICDRKRDETRSILRKSPNVTRGIVSVHYARTNCYDFARNKILEKNIIIAQRDVQKRRTRIAGESVWGVVSPFFQLS